MYSEWFGARYFYEHSLVIMLKLNHSSEGGIVIIVTMSQLVTLTKMSHMKSKANNQLPAHCIVRAPFTRTASTVNTSAMPRKALSATKKAQRLWEEQD